MIFCSINLFDLEQTVFVNGKLTTSVPLATLPHTLVALDNPDNIIYLEGLETVVQSTAEKIKELDKNKIIRMVTNV